MSIRKAKDNETTNDLYGFLTTDPNNLAKPYHIKAFPVILTTPRKVDQRMTASIEEVLKVQRPLPDARAHDVGRIKTRIIVAS